MVHLQIQWCLTNLGTAEWREWAEKCLPVLEAVFMGRSNLLPESSYRQWVVKDRYENQAQESSLPIFAQAILNLRRQADAELALELRTLATAAENHVHQGLDGVSPDRSSRRWQRG